MGRPRKQPGEQPANGKGSTFTRERIASGEVVHLVLLLERPAYEQLKLLAESEERSTAAQARWIIRQWLAESKPRKESA
jgi:hypothetical protein